MGLAASTPRPGTKARRQGWAPRLGGAARPAHRPARTRGGNAMPTMNVDGYELSYAESGAGDPLVLVHGTLGDQRYWAPQMATLGKHYRVLALSMRHCWPGEWTPEGDFTIDRHVADVAGFIRGLGVGPVRLVGHSRGGHIAVIRSAAARE